MPNNHFHHRLRSSAHSSLIIMICLLTLTFLSATVSAAYPLKVVDDLGHTVEFSHPPQRIISLTPAHTEIVYALGLESRLIGVDDFSDYPAAVACITKVGQPQTPSVELIISLRPDLIIAGDLADRAWVIELSKLNVPVVAYAPDNLVEVYEAITGIGQICGVEQKANDLVKKMKAQVSLVTTTVKKTTARPSVLFEIWSDPLYTAGPGSFIDELITLAGGRNVAASAKSEWPVLSVEAGLASNPDVIVTTLDMSMSVVSGPHKAAWAQVAAVRNKRVVQINQDMVSRPGPRLADGLLLMAKALHPNLF